MQTLMTMNVAALKAAALCVSKDKEAKLPFTVVRIEWDQQNLAVVVMDSTHIFCARVHYEIPEGAGVSPFVLNIPAEVIGKLPKAGHVPLCSLGEGRHALGDVVFTSVDTQYPPWRRLVASSGPVSGLAPAVLDPTIGEMGKKALATYHGVNVKSQSFSFGYYPQQGKPTVMFFGDDVQDPPVLFLMMPLRRELPDPAGYIPPQWAFPTVMTSA